MCRRRIWASRWKLKKKKANRKVRNKKHGMRDKDFLQWAYQQTGYDKRNQ